MISSVFEVIYALYMTWSFMSSNIVDASQYILFLNPLKESQAASSPKKFVLHVQFIIDQEIAFVIFAVFVMHNVTYWLE